MFRVSLVNMPFASVTMPSLALTQLKSILEEHFKDQILVDVYYLNHNFANHMGVDFYNHVSNLQDSQNSGLGDWFFRQIAFPTLPNNAGVYLTRYFPQRNDQSNKLKGLILKSRRGLEELMEDLITKYELDKADLVGFTSMFMQNVAVFAMAQKIKERNPNVTIIMGGANCESPMGQVIVKNVKQIDYVFSGPALKSLPEFVQHWLDHEEWKCSSIKGVFSKRNYIFHTGPDAIGEELSIDVPTKLEYDSFLSNWNENFANTGAKPILLFETSRGCWWGERAHCTFCGLNGTTMAYRSMKPELAIDLISGLFKFSSRVSRLESVDNILPKNYVEEVLPFINPPENMTIFYEVKADLSEQDVEVLSKAGVRSIQPGIESLTTSTLKLMKKGTSSFQNLMLLKNCLLHGVTPVWNLLMGFPGEKEEVYRKYVEDVPLLVHLPPPTGAYPVRFDRYSPYFVKAEEYKLDLHPLDYYSLIYPFEENDLENMAYFFADTNVDAEYAQTTSCWVGPVREQIIPWVDSWQQPSRATIPKLFFKEERDGTIIHDTRFGDAVAHDVGALGRDLLKYLNKPKDLVDSTRKFGHLPGFDVEREIGLLREKRLLFSETGRFLSLVLNRDPLATILPPNGSGA
jgi:ribosomal peptide maturation radical SAM protein 1